MTTAHKQSKASDAQSDTARPTHVRFLKRVRFLNGIADVAPGEVVRIVRFLGSDAAEVVRDNGDTWVEIFIGRNVTSEGIRAEFMTAHDTPTAPAALAGTAQHLPDFNAMNATDARRFVANQAVAAASQWFALMMRDNYAAVYLYYKPGALGCFTDAPDANWKLGSGERLHGGRTKEQTAAVINEMAQRLPFLCHE